MSIRATIVMLVVAILGMYAFRDWFKSLCGLIIMMALMQHQDMPRNLAGIQGLNPWNALMLVIVAAWLVARRRERLTWDMPRHINILLLLYLGVILVGWLRAVFDRSYLGDYGVGSLVSEDLINTVKWVIPALLLFDGCRTRKRLVWAVCAILIMYLGLAGQVAKNLPPSCAISGGAGVFRSRLKVYHEIGYSSCDMSAALAGASWAILGILPTCRRWWHKAAAIGLFALTSYANALTGGRAGYLGWGAAGLTLCAVRWRRYLILAPMAPFLLAIVLPAAAERMLTGFGERSATGDQATNDYEVTSGRNLIWPYVVEKISKSPVLGYGRLAMIRTGLRDQLANDLGAGEVFPHPHNMFLELLLDNGAIGAIPVLAFFCCIIFYSASLFRGTSSPWAAAAGGLALAMVVAQLVSGIGAQHFYPRESTVGMWAAMFLALRVHTDRLRARASTPAWGYAGALAPLPYSDVPTTART
jgi:O-antigen ligase